MFLDFMFHFSRDAWAPGRGAGAQLWASFIVLCQFVLCCCCQEIHVVVPAALVGHQVEVQVSTLLQAVGEFYSLFIG